MFLVGLLCLLFIHHCCDRFSCWFKPVFSGELERIKRCKGRVFALNEEPDVYRIWMPEDDCPGLAMARAFGDFCLKDYGLISVPDISYRKLTSKDEFVVLATDGVSDFNFNLFYLHSKSSDHIEMLVFV